MLPYSFFYIKTNIFVECVINIDTPTAPPQTAEIHPRPCNLPPVPSAPHLPGTQCSTPCLLPVRTWDIWDR